MEVCSPYWEAPPMPRTTTRRTRLQLIFWQELKRANKAGVAIQTCPQLSSSPSSTSSSLGNAMHLPQTKKPVQGAIEDHSY